MARGLTRRVDEFRILGRRHKRSGLPVPQTPGQKVAEHLSLSASNQDGHGRVVVRVSGKLDMLTAPELTAYLAGFDGANLTVDLANLSFLDSRGIAALVEAHTRLEEHGARLTLRDLPPLPRRTLEIAGLDTYLHLE
jgi:anti-anti-sigma factor